MILQNVYIAQFLKNLQWEQTEYIPIIHSYPPNELPELSRQL